MIVLSLSSLNSISLLFGHLQRLPNAENRVVVEMQNLPALSVASKMRPIVKRALRVKKSNDKLVITSYWHSR
jgi:hypothetical protein